ncbi:glucose 1-dehydrogenase [Desulfovibrio sp. OttesenSCG-928-C14]|nr:glucose 1-dehydrogenase [Desulfovibrio sp. OttesenSCG-928-C14]
MFQENLFSLAGKTALITGGAQGIGLCIARAFLDSGASVILADLNAEKLAETEKALLAQAPGRVAVRVCDICNQESVEQLKLFVEEKFPNLSILVNNAGIFKIATLEESSVEDMVELFNVNVFGMYRLSKTLLPVLKANKGGRIINLSSYVSEIARSGIGAYVASKGAVRQLTKAMAVEWAQYNIQVNAVAPGTIATAMTAKQRSNPEWQKMIERRVPMQRSGEPEEIAACVVFLAMDAAKYMTGVNLAVDGGILAAM